MLGPLSRSQATQRYSAFASRELTLWGHYRLGAPLGMGGGAGLPWPLSHICHRPTDAANSPPRPGIGYVATTHSCGGVDTTHFIPATSAVNDPAEVQITANSVAAARA
eukprot:2561579-Pyramimonas_sp.AAC.1